MDKMSVSTNSKLFRRVVIVLVIAVSAAGCGSAARYTVTEGMGPKPVLPQPSTSLIPTVNVVSAKGWPPDGAPIAAEGTQVVAFARGLDHPRWSTSFQTATCSSRKPTHRRGPRTLKE